MVETENRRLLKRRQCYFAHKTAKLVAFLTAAAKLQSVLEPYLLRRVKSQVALDLPKKTELVVYHGMSALQKKYYKALLMKDRGEAAAPRHAHETHIYVFIYEG